LKAYLHPNVILELTSQLSILTPFLRLETFKQFKGAALAGPVGKRVHIPAHKRGETVSYDNVRRLYPDIAQFYQSAELAELISGIVGAPVTTTPSYDQSSCSILAYTRPGDRIGWHFDHNFYKGRHFTALLTLVNTGAQPDQLSSARFLVERDGQEIYVPTPENTFVLFEGAEVRHAVSAQGEAETRIVLSMTFCTNPQATTLSDLQRRFKDVAYFGIRALWN
jgi:hypothetical protein